MTISKQALAKLPLVKTVNEAIDTFLTDWQLAAVAALTTFEKPDNGDADRQWWIAFAGNMLWASTVFCPAGSMVAAAASFLGAALAAGSAAKLMASEPQGLGTTAGKAMVMESLVVHAAKASYAFKQVSPAWSVDVLLPAIFDELSRQLEASSVLYNMRREACRRQNPNRIGAPDSFLQDDELFSWFNGNDGRKGDEWVKSFIWSNLMFLTGKVNYELRYNGLLNYFQRLLSVLQEQFENQREIYEYNRDVFVAGRVDSARGPRSPWSGKTNGMTPVVAGNALAEYKVTHPFIFKPFYGIAPKGDALTAVYSKFNVKFQ